MREAIFQLTYRTFVAQSVIKHRYNFAFYLFIFIIITFSPLFLFFLFCTFSWFLTALCFLSSFLFISARHRLRSSVQILAYADDIDIIGRTQSAMIEEFNSLEKAAKDMNLFVNQEKN
jgi:hypothetical protein